MNKTLTRLILSTVCVVALVLSGCGDDKSSGPSGDLFVICSGTIWNSGIIEGEATILRAELLFDGAVITSEDCSPACASSTLVGFRENVGRGNHTVAFRIASQTTSPVEYETVDGVTVETLESTYTLGAQTKTLATGQSISYTVNITN